MHSKVSSTAPFTPNERNVLLMTGVPHTATHHAELMYPTLAVALANESGIALERVLAWSFPGYLLFGLGALPGGFLADRFGTRRFVLLALAGMALSLTLAGFSKPGVPLVPSAAPPSPRLASCTFGCGGAALGRTLIPWPPPDVRPLFEARVRRQLAHEQ